MSKSPESAAKSKHEAARHAERGPRHGELVLPSVTLDAYNEELRDQEGFVGDRASGRAFRAILDDWRERIAQNGQDPLGNRATQEISKSQLDKAKRFEPREAGFSMVRHEPSKNSRAYRVLGGEPLTEITFRLPGLRWEHVVVGKRQVLSLTCLTPINETRTRITQVIWSDHPAFVLLKPFIAAGARAFLRQDGDMVNLQNEGLRYDPSLILIDGAEGRLVIPSLYLGSASAVASN